MAGYGYYDDAPARERTTRYVREERRTGGGDRDRRYEREEYLGVHPSSRDLVPRGRENSDLSVEEIQRDFPPPGYAGRDIRRARSAGAYDDYDDRRSYYDDDRDYERPRSRRAGSSVYIESEEKKRARVLGKQEQIIAAITGAALAIGGKELYDRHEAKKEGHDVHRNVLATAALGAAGGLVAYKGTDLYIKKQEKDKKSTMVVHKGRDGRVDTYYSDEEDDPKEKKGHKNFLEGALAAAGLGGAVKALTGGSSHDDRRSDTRSRGGSRSRSPRGKGEGANKIQKAAMASLIAGATEAFRVAKEPGAWKGEKAKRVLTAAAGAAAIDSSLSAEKGGSKLGLAESVIGGLVGNRVINGSKKNIEEDKKTGRSRSRSRARSEGGGAGSGLAALATAGLGALGAKKLYDSHKEDSRSRSRRRSIDSYDSRDESPDRRRQRSRSRSVVDKARNSLARLGIGNGVDDDDDRPRDRSRRRGAYDDDDDEPKGSRRHRSYDDDDDDYYKSKGRGGGRDRDYADDDRSVRGGGRERSRSRGGDRRRGSSRGSGSDSDLGDSDEDAKRAKKMRGKQIITTGLAAVATIHAAHNVYQSMEKRNSRHKAVKEGRLSPEEAKKLKSKALLQDAASVGIAALGIKGAISELKEANEMRHEMKEWKEQKEERHRRRMERLQRQKRLQNGDYDGRDGGNYDRHGADSWSPIASQKGGRYDEGPRYTDGNPYSAALPAPPVGYSDRRY
ncbi:hypothetical protein NKR19_g7680 [Coniochaeta hoffmannii]|uniref:DUF3824 domain-containing protein n=1 Tax=Coniochaeta hoffmannii TaxID=91930 RepID=A0AA38VPY0_9PEZI|nr:hypothetical protein NKR19_g7680 [Coniochaeta hoffmannii]